MKIAAESGERVTVIVPSRHVSNCAVMIEDDQRNNLVEVVIEDGLIGNVKENVARRYSHVEDRLTLWAHLVSEHGSCIGLDMSLDELIKGHEQEHKGPGTIRNHDPNSREARLPKIITVLSESDHYGLPRMTDEELRAHARSVNREIEFRLRAADDDYEGSFREAADNEGARIAAGSRKED